MKISIVTFVTIFALLSAFRASAEQIYEQHVEHVQTYTDFAVIRISGSGDNVELCTRQDAKKYVAIVLAGGKEMFSSVLSAYMANRRVGFGTSSCHPWGDTTIPRVYRVDVYKD